MKRIRYHILLLLSALLLMNPSGMRAQVDTTSDWKLEKDKNGILVYTRATETSKFKEYKSIVEMDASPGKLLEILLDVEAYSEWMAHVKEAEILKKEGENRFYIYSEVSVPWPFDNRDEVTLSVVERQPETGEISINITIIPDFIPEKSGKIRMPSGDGLWIFTPLNNGKTRVYHRFGGDPGGNIPAWIVNMFLVDGPYKTMTELRERVAGNPGD